MRFSKKYPSFKIVCHQKQHLMPLNISSIFANLKISKGLLDFTEIT